MSLKYEHSPHWALFLPLSSEYDTYKTVRPDSGLVFQVKVIKPFYGVPSSAAGCVDACFWVGTVP